MKQLVYNFIAIRVRILGINIANTFNLETAFPAENWANIFSTLLYTASYILFLNVIFGNIRTLAGYSYNDMLFFTFLSQLAFYTLFNWSYDNLNNMVESVHQGEMDLLLTKPLPTLFYICTRQFSLVKMVRDAFLPMLMIGFLINWSSLDLSSERVLVGIIVFICGQLTAHVLQFILSLPAFWSGQSQALLRISYTMTNPNLPLEGLTKFWRVFLTTILPVCLPVSGAISVMLGRTDMTKMAVWSITLAAIAFTIRYYGWRKALAVYNSASS